VSFVCHPNHHPKHMLGALRRGNSIPTTRPCPRVHGAKLLDAVVVVTGVRSLLTHCRLRVFRHVRHCVEQYYYYYKASFMKYRPWWRPLITKGQIVQFCAGMGTSFVWYGSGCWLCFSPRAARSDSPRKANLWHAFRQYNSFENFRFSSSFPFIDYDKSICSGSPYLVLWSQWLTMSLLVLFSIFFYTTFVLKRDRKLAAEAEAEAAKKGN